MSMTKGQVVKTTDITSAINNKVTSYLPTVSNPDRKTTFDGNRNTILNAVKGFCNTLDGKKGSTINAIDVLNCIIDSMYEACCCGTLTYSVYQYHDNRNLYTIEWSWWGPSVHSVYPPTIETSPLRGIYKSKNVSRSTYESSANSGVTQLRESVAAGKVISAVKLTDILDKFIAYNRSTEKNSYLGLLDTCYTSCHLSCHGSSRSRR